jgi:hypothetical protein
MKIRILILLVFCLSVISSYSQSAIKATIDESQLLIGEQTTIHIEVAGNKDASLEIPSFDKFIMKGVEIIEQSEPDTTDIGNNRMRIKYDYLITSFDEGLYSIPPFKVVEGKDTTFSDELALKIITIPVDTIHVDKYNDIKDVITPPRVWKDYANYFLYPLLGLLLIGILVVLYLFFIKKKRINIIKKEKPELPSHVIALNELNNIKTRKLWQNGRIKEYHSQITDTLREYMERRFDIQAMEMTSGEILDKARGISDIDNVYDKLKQILLLADLTKFAKYQALPDENELSMMNAYLFVNETKKEDLPEEKPEETENKQETTTDNEIKD